MRLLSDLKAIKSIERIKNGGTEKLSVSQITGVITNMMDARKNLNYEQFNEVYSLFRKLRKIKTKTNMSFEEYYEKAIDIINKFDAIAPYENYSGHDV